MNNDSTQIPSSSTPDIKDRVGHPFRNLKELLDTVSGKSLRPSIPDEAGVLETVPYPFLAIVGQKEMKLALLIGLINPAVGGILLIGPRGTAKTTAVRSLQDILPKVERSLCYYGCLPEDIEAGGVDAICPDCAKKFAEGLPLTALDRVRLIELPLNARMEDVVGGIDERHGATNVRTHLHRGILAQAHRNLLYVDEINLLSDEIIDAILDAAAQGIYTVRRGPISATFRSRFVLIGSMNPEEGKLRPQILDRFGLRVIIRGLESEEERLEAYNRVKAYTINPREMSLAYGIETSAAAVEIQAARDRLHKVTIPKMVLKPAIKQIKNLDIDSLRADITWFEAARAYAAADGRLKVSAEDLKYIAPMALRLRRSQFILDYFKAQEDEEEKLKHALEDFDHSQRSTQGRHDRIRSISS